MSPIAMTLGSLAAVSAGACAVFAAKRMQLRCKLERQTINRVQVVNGGADLSTWGEDTPRLSFYICYVRRMREKAEQAQSV
jgi:hypothetical protein